MVELEEDRITRYCQALAFAEQQAGQLVERRPDFLPMFTTQGHWQSDNAQPLDWSEGFLAGLLWQLFRRTGDARWQDLAERYARLVEPRQHDTHSYDLGMIFLHSHLPWYELTNDRRVRSVLFAAGTTLAQRFHYRGRFFSSGANRESLSITMMMNVPLIQWVANTRLDQDLARFVVAHARTTRDQLVRQDGSTAQALRYDSEAGRFADQHSTLGLNDASVWARGLAWSIYGFTLTYALTQGAEFLKVARRNAEYWLEHLPEDKIPLWDFAASDPGVAQKNVQRDTSSAAIAASALLDLAQLDPRAEHAIAYRSVALAMLDVLVQPENLAAGREDWEGILLHGVYNFNRGLGVDESLICGDYFLVEALTKVVLAADKLPTH